jgi:hypothetical protein
MMASVFFQLPLGHFLGGSASPYTLATYGPFLVWNPSSTIQSINKSYPISDTSCHMLVTRHRVWTEY